MLSEAHINKIKQMTEKEAQLEIKEYWGHIKEFRSALEENPYSHIIDNLNAKIIFKHYELMQIIMLTNLNIDDDIKNSIDEVVKNNQHPICDKYRIFREKRN